MARNLMLRWAKAPFYFNSAAQLTRIGTQRATTLGEFAQALEKVPEDAIFQHTFQTLQEHHYIQEGFSNDFLGHDGKMLGKAGNRPDSRRYSSRCSLASAAMVRACAAAAAASSLASRSRVMRWLRSDLAPSASARAWRVGA